MTTVRRVKDGSPFLVLVVGLVTILLLQSIALRSAVASPLLGLALGVTESVLAWRMTSTPRTWVLRWLLAVFGMTTILLAVFYAVEQPV